MASNLTRKELLKQDKFTVEAEHTVDYLSAHRKEVIRYGGIALAVVVIVAGVYLLPQFPAVGPPTGSRRSDRAHRGAGRRRRSPAGPISPHRSEGRRGQ